ncbi:MAG: hypothetical protein JNG90_09750 [Planctomycetaceae bacterium]|nr:hypothetical protein [Planctomycetaceae bacterium]
MTIKDIADGWTNTLAFLEVRQSIPQDARYATISIDAIEQHLDKNGLLSAFDIHDRGRGLMFLDGAIYRQQKPLSRQQLRALMTINGGEDHTRKALEATGTIKLYSGRHSPVLNPQESIFGPDEEGTAMEEPGKR